MNIEAATAGTYSGTRKREDGRADGVAIRVTATSSTRVVTFCLFTLAIFDSFSNLFFKSLGAINPALIPTHHHHPLAGAMAIALKLTLPSAVSTNCFNTGTESFKRVSLVVFP